MSEKETLFTDVHERLIRLSDDAIEELPWPELAQYIDSLNEEYQWFNDLIRERGLGRDVPRPPRRTKP